MVFLRNFRSIQFSDVNSVHLVMLLSYNIPVVGQGLHASDSGVKVPVVPDLCAYIGVWCAVIIMGKHRRYTSKALCMVRWIFGQCYPGRLLYPSTLPRFIGYTYAHSAGACKAAFMVLYTQDLFYSILLYQ